MSDMIIKPGASSKRYWRDIWDFRELFYVLAWRDVSVRYKQTVIGLAWAVLQPVCAMIVFSIIFGRVANMPTEGDTPYPLLVYAGMLPWQLFASSLVGASGSLIGNASLVSKVYFPRLIVPISSVVVAFVDFLISFCVLCVIMIWYQYVPSWHIVFLPFFLLMVFFASMGAGVLLASLNVKYRDFRYIVPFVIQLGLYISPVGFSSTVVPDEWRLLYSMNPVVGIIDGFRWAILGQQNIYIPGFLLSWGIIFVLCVFGIRQFRVMERKFADLI